MSQFPHLRYLGQARVDLDEVPSDGEAFEAGDFYEEPSEAETIPGSPPQLRNPIDIIEVEESDSEVEVVKVAILLTPVQEQLKMQNEERYGHFHRVSLKNEQIEKQLKRVIEDRESMTPEERRLRRMRIREQLV